MGSQQSSANFKKARVCVENKTGVNLLEVQVVHVFRQDVNNNVVQKQAWTNLDNGKTTGADLEVWFQTGLGDWTNYDYWFVQYACKNAKGEVEYYVFNPAAGKFVHGCYKQCYLTAADENGVVTITLDEENNATIKPPKSSSAATRMTKRGGFMRYPYKEGWTAFPGWVKVTFVAVAAGAAAAATGGLAAAPMAGALGLGATSTAALGGAMAAGGAAYNKVNEMKEAEDAEEYTKTGSCLPCAP